MKTNNNETILQQDICMSKCMLWDLQKEFFHASGIDAWNNKVPFYITSNLFLANTYAKIIIGFIRDCIEKYKGLSEPFYILELGVGSGRFSFYLLKRLVEIEKTYGLKNSFVYVMSDFTENNLKFWKKHSRLEPYLEQGYLDFALYNAESDLEIKLINAGKKLKRNTLAKPLIVVANYFFDTIPHDVFRIKDNKLQEGLVSLTTTNKEDIRLDKIKESYVYRDVELPYYQEKELNIILEYYKKSLSDSTFLFPIIGLRCIKNLSALSSSNLLLLSTDKGHTTLFELDQPNDPVIAHHASFSVDVNFHAIGEYCRSLNGDFWHQSIRPGIKTSLFFINNKLECNKKTQIEVLENIEDFSLSGFYDIHSHINKSKFDCGLGVILAFLQLSRWDPHIFNTYFTTIIGQVQSTTETVKRGLISAMLKIAENFYFIPGSVDAMYYIGDFFRIMQDYKIALVYYNKSIDHFGEKYETLLNIGICYYHMKDFIEARKIFKEAYKVNLNSCTIESWIAKAEEKSKTLLEIDRV